MSVNPIYTPQDLEDVRLDPRLTVSTGYWRTFYPRTVQSGQAEIRFDKLDAGRRIAPFRLPTEPGAPIMKNRGETVEAFTPAYLKPKDPVVPSEQFTLTPGETSRRIEEMTPEERFDRRVVEIVLEHDAAIRRAWDVMCARGMLDGKLTITYPRDQGMPVTEVTLDFGRDAGHTITLGVNARWGDDGVDIFDTLETWINLVANAEFGGMVSDVILGSEAAVPFRASEDIKDKLDVRFRGSEDVSINRGLVVTNPLNPFTLLGRLSEGVRVWQISGPANTFQNDDDTFTQIMDPRDVLLYSPSFNGIMGFGAIADHNARFASVDIYQRMFDDNDPPLRHILSQSAPLPIPVNPNCTLRARVVE